MKLVENTLKEYKINKQQVIAFVGDNAANIQACGRILNIENYFGCVIHLLHLSVKSAFKSSIPIIKRIS